MEQTALMFAAASNRVEAMKALIAAGADVKATTKVVEPGGADLARGGVRSASSNSRRRTGGAQAARRPAPRREPRAGRAAAPHRAAGGRGGGRRGPAQGGRRRRSAVPLQRAGRLPGRHDAAALRGAPGVHGRGRRAARGRRRRQPVSAGDKSSPLVIAMVNGHFDIAMHLLDKGAEPQPGGRERRRAALRRAQRAVGAQGALPAAARLPAAEDGVPRDDEGAARQGRRRQRPPALQGVVLGLQLRPVGRRRDRRDAVLARRLRQRRRGDEAAGRRTAPTRNIPTTKPAGRPRVGDAGVRAGGDVSGLPPVPVGGPGVTPLQAAAGVGYGEGFAANSHRYAPERHAGGGEVPGRGAGRRRQRRRPRGQHRPPPRRGARRRRDDRVPGVEGRRRHRASTARARPPPTWPTARCSAPSRIPRR